MWRCFLRLRKNGSPYFANNFGNSNEFMVTPTHLTFNTNKNNVTLLRTIGVMFGDTEKRVSEYVK